MAKRAVTLLVMLLLVGTASKAEAAIIFSLSQGSIQPDENVVFNETGLISGPALTVTGATNNTGLLVSFTGQENLITPSGGQARVASADGNGFSTLTIDFVDPALYFSEFEANVRIFSQTSGTGTALACDQFSVCSTFTFALASGENFFVLSVLSPQLLNTVTISSAPIAMMDIRQVRVSAAQCSATSPCRVTTVPEPAMLALLGLALTAGAARLRRRGKSTRT
jgi:hypothetical protein